MSALHLFRPLLRVVLTLPLLARIAAPLSALAAVVETHAGVHLFLQTGHHARGVAAR